MRKFCVVVTLVACGPAAPHNSKPYDPNESIRTIDSDQMSEQERDCNAGKTMGCIMFAKHYLEPPTYALYKKDPAKAKEIETKACTDTTGSGEENKPNYACQMLMNDKLITDPTEAANLCKTTDFACDAVVLSNVLSEEQVFQLCTQKLDACHLVQSKTMTLSEARKQEAAFLSTLYIIDHMIIDAAIHKVVDDDGDDASDSQCHKDTDCKGDRICQSGSCVDAPAKSAPASKPAKVTASKLGSADCDALIDGLRAAKLDCNPALKQQLTGMADYLAVPWKDIPKEDRPLLAASCKVMTDKAVPLTTEVCK